MSEMKGLIGSMSRKWKIDHGTSKKLEIENKLMEERLNQLKTEMNKEKEQRSARGAASWSRGQTGPMSSYGKNVLQDHKAKTENLLANKPTKIKLLKDEVIPVPPSKGHRDTLNKEKTIKCGQCEKKFAFVHCVECSEDYCINCFASFHSKGALKKHRSLPFNSEGRIKTPIIDVMPSPPTSAKPDRQQKMYDTNNSSRQTSSNVSERRMQQHVQFVQEPKLFSARNGSAGSDKSDNQMYYEMNEADYYNQIENYDDEVGVGTSVGAGGTGSGGGLLLDGNFNENESHEEFMQAVLEWRNGGNKSAQEKPAINRNSAKSQQPKKISKKNVDVGTDNTEEQRKSSFDMQQNIELQINFNHSLSYAERLLLKKYRRSDVEEFFNVNTQMNTIDDISINPSSSVKMSRDKTMLGQQHIDFNQLMKVLQVDGEPVKVIENLEEEYKKRLNEPVRESLLFKTNEDKIPIQFEEVGSSMKSVNLESMKIRQNTILNEIKQKEERLNNTAQINNQLSLDLGDIEKPKSAKLQITSTTSRTQANSSRKESARQKSARINSARKNSDNLEFESHLTQKPSDTLKSIADRSLPAHTMNSNLNQSDLGSFFLLSVENKDTKPQDQPDRPLSAIKNAQKISYKLYEMSPRSWRPTSSLANNETITTTKIDSSNYNNEINNANLNNNNNNNNIKKSVEKSDSRNIVSKETQVENNEKINILKISTSNINNNTLSTTLSSINRQSTSSSLTTVSKDYDSIMRSSSGSSNKNKINNININSNTSSVSTSKTVTNRSVESKTPLKNIPLNNSNVKIVNKKNDTIEFKLSKGLNIKPSSSVSSSSSSTIKNSRNSAKFSQIKSPKVRANLNMSRPRSVLSRCGTPSNPQNIELAEQFSTYDEDDGRTSRNFQNEDDDEYFNELGNEFTKSGNINFNTHHDKPSTADENAILKLINSKKQLTQADLNELFTSNIEGNFEEDEEYNSDLDLEDLKSLK